MQKLSDVFWSFKGKWKVIRAISLDSNVCASALLKCEFKEGKKERASAGPLLLSQQKQLKTILG